jgi:hypothetical protein
VVVYPGYAEVEYALAQVMPTLLGRLPSAAEAGAFNGFIGQIAAEDAQNIPPTPPLTPYDLQSHSSALTSSTFAGGSRRTDPP